MGIQFTKQAYDRERGSADARTGGVAMETGCSGVEWDLDHQVPASRHREALRRIVMECSVRSALDGRLHPGLGPCRA